VNPRIIDVGMWEKKSKEKDRNNIWSVTQIQTWRVISQTPLHVLLYKR